MPVPFQKQVEASVCVTMEMVKDALDQLRGAVMIVYPMGLPPYDPIRLEFENKEDLSGTQVCGSYILSGEFTCPPKEQKPLKLEPPLLGVIFCFVHSFKSCHVMCGGRARGSGEGPEGAVLTAEGVTLRAAGGKVQEAAHPGYLKTLPFGGGAGRH